MAVRREIDVAISQSIIDETLRVLCEKFSYLPSELEEASRIIEACGRRVEPTMKLNVVPDDPQANHIIEAAVAAGAEAIVTGDKKHLLKMGSYQGIRMIRVEDLLQQQTR